MLLYLQMKFTFRWLSPTVKADIWINEGSVCLQEQDNASGKMVNSWCIVVKHTGVFILLFFQLFCRFEIIPKKLSGGRRQRSRKVLSCASKKHTIQQSWGGHIQESIGGWGWVYLQKSVFKDTKPASENTDAVFVKHGGQCGTLKEAKRDFTVSLHLNIKGEDVQKNPRWLCCDYAMQL